MSLIDGMYFSQFRDPKTGEIDWRDVERFEADQEEDIVSAAETPPPVRVYTIYVCPECGAGPETTPYLPGVGKRGDPSRRCSCGYVGGFASLEVSKR